MVKTIFADKKLKIKPNLADYSKLYNSFEWSKAKREITPLSNGKINMAFNVLDEQALGDKKNKVALFWEGEKNEFKKFTFFELYLLANQFGNFLKKLKVKKGERVFFFLPRVPELYFGFLGALKIGAVAGTLFPAFGSEALYDRLKNSGAKILITNKELLPRLEGISHKLPDLKKIILTENLSNLLREFSVKLKALPMKPEDPAFMLYTSATGNTPVSGIVIPHKAILQQKLTAQWVLDLKDEDTYWCTADPGWVTGVVYGLLAPWSLGISQLIFSGHFTPEKWYELIEKYRVSVLYTAPTALRMLQIKEKIIKNYNLSSLRHMTTVGEALPPSAFDWVLKNFKVLPHDTWWQTETGAMMITNYPCLPIKPGSMGKPIPGIKAAIIDENGKELGTNKEGDLAFKPNWPARMQKIWKNEKLYQSYFGHGWYLSGDHTYRDKDGYYWFSGRKSEIIKTSGERVGTFEVESVLGKYPTVLETAIIGKPDELRGEIIKAFVVLKPGIKPSEALKKQLQTHVKSFLAGHAYPREIEFVKSLPKNKSGKIMRRLLKNKELGLPLGDTSTLES